LQAYFYPFGRKINRAREEEERIRIRIAKIRPELEQSRRVLFSAGGSHEILAYF